MKTREYPEFCDTCHNLATCKQKENMLPIVLANGQAIVITSDGFVADCDTYCEDCAPEGADPMFGEECDAPQHCCCCGAPLRHSLTAEGARYVREAVAEGDGCCRLIWPIIWADYLDNSEFTCPWCDETYIDGLCPNCNQDQDTD